MSWTFVGASTNFGAATGGIFNQPQPPGVADGDLIIAVMFDSDPYTGPGQPIANSEFTSEGFTVGPVLTVFSSGDNDANLRAFYKVASGEPANYTLDNPGTAGAFWMLAVLAWRWSEGTPSSLVVDSYRGTTFNGYVEQADTPHSIPLGGYNPTKTDNLAVHILCGRGHDTPAGLNPAVTEDAAVTQRVDFAYNDMDGRLWIGDEFSSTVASRTHTFNLNANTITGADGLAIGGVLVQEQTALGSLSELDLRLLKVHATDLPYLIHTRMLHDGER